MAAQLIDGKTISEALLNRSQSRRGRPAGRGRRAPALAVVLVATTRPRKSMRNKSARAKKLASARWRLICRPAPLRAELLAIVDQVNADPEIDGILVQLPLPAHIDADAVIERIDPKKDVDGFHPGNIGRLALKNAAVAPAPPRVMTMLEMSGIDPRANRGDHWRIQYCRPADGAGVLLARATVTVCHSATADLAAEGASRRYRGGGGGQTGLCAGRLDQGRRVVVDVGIKPSAGWQGWWAMWTLPPPASAPAGSLRCRAAWPDDGGHPAAKHPGLGQSARLSRF